MHASCTRDSLSVSKKIHVLGLVRDSYRTGSDTRAGFTRGQTGKGRVRVRVRVYTTVGFPMEITIEPRQTEKLERLYLGSL